MAVYARIACAVWFCLLMTPAVAAVPLEHIELPDGFHIEVFSGDVPGARSMVMSEDGTLFVGVRMAGHIYAVQDTDGDYRGDKVYRIDTGLSSSNGVALRDGNLYVAGISRVIQFPDIEKDLAHPPKAELVWDQLPDKRHHGWKYIAFGPDGWLYVPVGAPCNVCEEEDARFSSLMRLNVDTKESEIFAHGIRNTVGFDWHPETGVLWFTDNGRDDLGDNVPPDELNRAPNSGMHFGFPYCHGGTILDPKFGQGKDCGDYVPPARNLGPHVAALGMLFYTGNQFPSEYRNAILIAEHGSWNRSSKIGYRVMKVDVKEGQATSYEPFAYGWKQGEKAWGRPVDIIQLPDGSILVSDDHSGTIYRIHYQK